jgi:uncharacterized protein YbjT (DUF2867 family)
MANDRTILIAGVTGQQGGAVAQALRGTGFHLRGLTRKPESERAVALAHQGIEIVKGDLDDEATLRRALAGAWGVFGVQNAGEAGVEREEAQGKRLATVARNTGVEHYVYTSVGSANKRTGVPHFDNKWRIEETVRGLRFPSHVILRPVFFMENLTAPFSLQGSTLAWVLGPDTKLQMIAVEDIGWFGARAFTDATRIDLYYPAGWHPYSARCILGKAGIEEAARLQTVHTFAVICGRAVERIAMRQHSVVNPNQSSVF